MPPEVEEQIEEVLEPVIEEVEEVEEQDEPEEKQPVNTQAQALWDLLNNQATAKSTLQTIAANLGLTVAESKTEEAKTAIKDVIKMALGEDLAFLGDKLGPLGDALEGLINDRISKAELKSTERHQQQEAARFEIVVNNTIKELNTETKGEFNNLMPAINKLMEEMPIGRQTPEQYLRRLYRTAKNEASESVRKPSNEKVEKARRESQSTAVNGTANVERVKNGSSVNPSYREAIAQAIREQK